MSKTARFCLEEHIMNCWNVVDDIKSVYAAENLSEDDMQNALLGLMTLYQIKFEHLFACFEAFIRERNPANAKPFRFPNNPESY